jgi:hypothetical protein
MCRRAASACRRCSGLWHFRGQYDQTEVEIVGSVRGDRRRMAGEAGSVAVALLKPGATQCIAIVGRSVTLDLPDGPL